MNKIEFIDWFIKNQVNCDIKGENIPDNLRDVIFYTLTRQEELICKHRDHWGNFDWSFSESHLNGTLYKPWLDISLKQANQAIYSSKWPLGKRFALCLTHDVDIVPVVGYGQTSLQELFNKLATINQLPANLAYKAQEGIKSTYLAGINIRSEFIHRSKTTQQYERWIKLEDQFGFKSTFYFFPSLVTKRHYWDCFYSFDNRIRFDGKDMTVTDMARNIDQAGWEIGLHSSYYSATNLDLLLAQKKHTEDLLKKEIVSVRQHYLHYDAAKTPNIHAEAGFKTDSTQGYNRTVGFRAGTAFPYPCWDNNLNQGLPIIEIPLHIMDVSLFRPDTLNYNEDLAIRHCMLLMDEVEKVGGCLTLNWHPNLVVPPVWWNVYKVILEEAHYRNAWGCGAKDIYEWMTRTNPLT